MKQAVETADADGAEFDRVQAINLRGVWNCMKYELRQMREQGSGAIVNCASIARWSTQTGRRWAGGPMNRVALRTVGARVQLRGPPNSSIFTYSSVLRAFHVLVRHTTKTTPFQRP
ncbi:SDR family NAD(P)-dependent oxidoreductase [Streptomyces flaveolus]|uniref:SDR family NAD(P)-dependent oxidoreductase n=1 Tax=Streptomyces flaveolus TaxID=67297 RepID=UPI003F4E264F